MLNVFDTVLTSNDMSIERVLHAGLPVALLLYDSEPSADLQQTLDELAHKYAGKVLVVRLSRKDGPETIKKFDIGQFPALLSVRTGRPVARQDHVNANDVRAHIAHLAGEGPMPSAHTPESQPSPKQVASEGPLQVNEAEFEREVLQSERPVLVDFWAEWCGPCRMMEPALEKLARQYGDTLKVVKVNVDDNPGISSRYGITGIPTMLIIQNGREADRLVGALPASALRNRLARWIPAKS